MTKLDMSDEYIDKIKPGAFSPGLEDKVEMLFMIYNSISRLAAGTFDGLDGVRKIFMWENNIRAIEAGAFRGCPSLEKLDLSSNELRRRRTFFFTFIFQRAATSGRKLPSVLQLFKIRLKQNFAVAY